MINIIYDYLLLFIIMIFVYYGKCNNIINIYKYRCILINVIYDYLLLFIIMVFVFNHPKSVYPSNESKSSWHLESSLKLFINIGRFKEEVFWMFECYADDSKLI